MKLYAAPFAAAVAMAALVIPAVASAQTEPWSLSVTSGVDYSSGDYGLAEDTDILVAPVSVRVTNDQWAFSASIPYISIDSPGGVVVGPGGQPLPGVPSAGGDREGFGDLNLGANYTMTHGEYDIDLGARVKLPTSDEDEQLGTGEADYAVSAEVSRVWGGVIPFVNVGYRVLGDTDTLELEDGLTASAGLTVPAGNAVWIFSYDYAEATTSGTEDSQEVFGGLSLPLGERTTVIGYGIAGLSEGSPDLGAGVLFTYRLF
jgi:hypothetical protein